MKGRHRDTRSALALAFAATLGAIAGCGGGGGGGGGGGSSGTAPVTSSVPSGSLPAPPPGVGASATPVTVKLNTPTYYVDFVSGSDTNAGTSPTAAFMHCPGDTNATGVAASTVLQPGNGVVFKGGVSYEGTVNVAWSGSASAAITYDGNSAGTFGTGLAIIDGARTRSVGIQGNAQSSILINAFQLSSFATNTSSTAISFVGGSNVEIANCRISEVYYSSNPAPGTTTWEIQYGTGIFVDDCPGAYIHDNIVRDCGNACIALAAESGLQISGGTISHNETTNMNWGINVALGNSDPGTVLSNVQIVGNYVHDFDNYEVCSAWHRDGVFVFARPDTSNPLITDVEIADNYFEDTTSGFGSTAWIYIEYNCTDFKIHHNVLNTSPAYFSLRILDDVSDGTIAAGNHQIYNNTFYNVSAQGNYGMHIERSTGCQLMNNIFFVDLYAYAIMPDSMSGFASDHNLFYRSDGQPEIAILNSGPANALGSNTFTLATLQAQTPPYDEHSLYGNPVFATSPSTITSSPLGFELASGSPAIGAGTSLGFTADFSGDAIPTTSPDLGAFQHP
jgi:hypothetical protein